MIDPGDLENFKEVYPDAVVRPEGEFEYVHIPLLKITDEVQSEALLCPQLRDGYETRLFLSTPLTNKGQNWTQHQILGRAWHSWSWQHISPNQGLIQILLGHLTPLR